MTSSDVVVVIGLCPLVRATVAGLSTPASVDSTGGRFQT
jgi:hypothetical protein